MAGIASRYCISRDLLATASVPWDFLSHREKHGATALLYLARALGDGVGAVGLCPIERSTALA